MNLKYGNEEKWICNSKFNNTQRNELFGKIPHWFTDSGGLNVLSGKAAKVLIALSRYADFQMNICRPGNKSLSKKSGVSYKSVFVCIKELESLGIIDVQRNGYKRNITIIHKPPVDIERRIKSISPVQKKYRNSFTRDLRGRFISQNAGNSYPKKSDKLYPKKSDTAYVSIYKVSMEKKE